VGRLLLSVLLLLLLSAPLLHLGELAARCLLLTLCLPCAGVWLHGQWICRHANTVVVDAAVCCW
jgi:hypothetical protein